MPETTHQIRLASRPEGEPRPENFEIVELNVPEPAEGEALVRNSYLSVDPYMRGRMRDAASYQEPYAVGEVMPGGAVGQVVASRNADLPEGSWVHSLNGWREHFTTSGKGTMAIDPTIAPVSTALGVLGMTGLTAYVGLYDFGKPTEGETVFVSAAAGAVGSVAGQLARLEGCRVVGSAGSDEKVDYLTGELGFDAAFNYKDTKPLVGLKEHAPEGVDVYFANVGGDHLDAALARMNVHGRIALCGAVSGYNDEQPQPGPRNFLALLTKRINIRGYIILDHYHQLGEFLERVAPHVRSGEVAYRETVVEGIENMPEAFIGLLAGVNIGKMLVKVGPDAD
jgi:NADPH-dependent curcumin reductase CurA